MITIVLLSVSLNYEAREANDISQILVINENPNYSEGTRILLVTSETMASKICDL